MIKTALSRRLVTSLFSSRQQQHQPKRLKSTTDDDFGDLKSVKHIPSVTFDEASDDFPAAKTEEERDPVMIHRENVFSKYKQKGVGQARQVWVESLDTSGTQNKDLLRLHPDVWSVKPRLDILWQNINWQKRYRRVDFDEQKDRWEMHYGGRPWPQKGTGKARHASKTSPIWHQGGKAHPNFGIRGHFYMLPVDVRIQGLTNALSAKLAQDDLRVVSNLDVPSTDPDYIEKLIDDRGWGISALISDVSDIFPEDITAATEPVQHVNLMPCYGLNVHSILKHKTLVLTVDAVNYLEDKLLYAMNRVDYAEKNIKSSTYGYSIY